ncbi:MAG TPA: carboxylating nicotinate-nucleotide diphosphorylase [Dehalococcoidia bacterium]|nr:carboxylating nicotinate-nucleotide diphosphorylase [Dehalococcoidia bacterium]
MKLSPLLLGNSIEQALIEDLFWGDITSDTLLDPEQISTGHIKAKAKGVLAGIEVAGLIFHQVDPDLEFIPLCKDGTRLTPGRKIARIRGKTASMLKVERVALNFVQHLSGIATLTSLFVKAVEGLPVKITDTRKTTPGLRLLEKGAVLSGGGFNHRLNLGDSFLIKNNHLTSLRRQGLSISAIIEKAKRQNTIMKRVVEIEVRSIEEALEAAKAHADIIMLDNMLPGEMRKAVAMIKGKAVIEASGGVTLDNVRAIAQTGVDIISVGALTHSAKALDISMTLD